MERWYAVVMLFKVIVWEDGPHASESICNDYEKAAIAYIDTMARRNVEFRHAGKVIQRKDVTTDCIRR